MSGLRPLPVDDDELAACVACGLCLPHCPTFRVTGDETRSPRGRIAAMRAVQWQGVSIDDPAFVRVMDECVQCRGCETACPSGVPFGHLMEGAREALATRVPSYQPWWKRAGYRVLTHHRLLLAASSALGVAQRLRVLPRRVSSMLPPSGVPIRRAPLLGTGSDVYLFTGCVMDAWLRPTHAAVIRVLGAYGFGVALPEAGAGRRSSAKAGTCCGALHVHAGLVEEGRRLAERALASMPGDAPILVDSAGCGAWLKEHSHSPRVKDVHEFLAEHADRLPVAPARRAATRPVVAVQDPCHLRHVQGVHLAVREVLAPYADIVELDDDGLCCGAGGAYAAQHPELAGAVRDRKVQAVRRAGASVVASANPGCAMWLANAGLPMKHPLEIVDEVLRDG